MLTKKASRSEEHTSELQSHHDLVCRLLLEKKKNVTPPAKLEEGHFSITAYATHDGEKFTTSLEPLPSMPTILWSETAQCVVLVFNDTATTEIYTLSLHDALPI